MATVLSVTRLCTQLAFANARATFAQFCEWSPSQRSTLRMVDAAGAEALNAKLEEIWPVLSAELEAFSVPVDVMEKALKDSGGPTTAMALGIDVDFYREAVLHAREIRKRYSALDVAADGGYLEEFAQNED